jgi:hypothetical protein
MNILAATDSHECAQNRPLARYAFTFPQNDAQSFPDRHRISFA